MNNLMGMAPRHPGLWVDLDSSLKRGDSNTISTTASCTQGKQELQALTPELARLSQQGQWVVLISPPNIGYKQMLADGGVRMDRILLVHTKDEVETLWAMEKALTSGTSSAVICWAQTLDARDSRRLQIVAKNTRALGVVIEDANGHLPAKAFSQEDLGGQTMSLFSSLH
ncbi:cell division protein [Shewanella insulae]|uniref:cell division inhibitor SulA n=1 Tax=Shewanella insulae TaxID=2681496 RepID=UPI001EFEE642|nr:SulA-like leucine-rich domain-containing protein [Shewanella insulae]MCG9739407.1 cell division protein [Shewanella insulae]MCG9755171.1 cell division protein [Shewanella insulae]